MKIDRRLLVVMILLTCAIVGGPWSVSLAQGAGAIQPRAMRESPWLLEGVHHPSSQALLTAKLDDLPAGYGDCSKLVYQSHVDGEWQIVLADGDGRNGVQLTQAGTENYAPSLSPDCDEIAFGSTRGGSHVLYLMNIDGTDVRQLTDAADGDMLPAFSPDGTRIAFQSYRDGDEPEVYVLELSSNQLTRLTNDEGYDGQPDWSPDGAKITFISGRSGEKNIWIMNSDGSDQHRITTMPYCGGPVWSPDGDRIAFAGDYFDTGYTYIWIIDVDGTNARPVYEPSALYHDTWPGAWSADAKYIIYEEADWTSGLVSASLDVVDPDNTDDRQSLVSGGTHMSPDWKSHDQTPPTSEVSPLPAQSTQTFVVRWSGWDACSTPIEYQVQYRLSLTSAWVDWDVTPGQAWTTDTRHTFQFSEPGTVYFRCRARDSVGNTESWPSGNGDTQTSYEAPPPITDIIGYVYDVTGQPLRAASLFFEGNISAAAMTAENGRFDVSIEEMLDEQLIVRAVGYREQVLPPLWCGVETPLRSYMTTNPNAVINGGFESGQAAWYASPSVSFIASDVAYGARIAQLGYNLLSGESASQGAGQVIKIEQSVSIPFSMTWPTLSMLCVLGDGSGSDAGQLDVYIDEGNKHILVLTLSRPTTWHSDAERGTYPAWQHLSADLSDWAGKTVTVRICYSPNWSYKAALLDQVSISSWRSPSVTKVTPRTVIPGSETAITIHGANLSLAHNSEQPLVQLGGYSLIVSQASDSAIRAMVPSTMPLGLHMLVVTNTEDYVGALPAAVSVGGNIVLPLIVRNGA